MSQGQSLSTIDKERQLAALISQERNILKMQEQRALAQNRRTILNGRPFYWIDLNCGCGYNHQFHVPGSPLVFLEVMFDIPYRAWFIDRDAKATDQLKTRLQCRQSIEICTKDNRDALLEIARCLPPNPVGGILADPNTWAYRNSKNGAGIPVDELRDFCFRNRRMDLLMNLNTRVFSMMDGHNNRGVTRYDLIALDDFPTVFDRQYWLISYSHNGHTGFVRLAGRNMPTGDYKKWGWYHWDSPQGQRIRENIRVRKRDRVTGQLDLSMGESA